MAKQSKHPGVVLVKPNPKNPNARRTSYGYRWKEPPDADGERRIRKATFGRDVRTKAQREAVMIAKSREIAAECDRLDGGAPRKTGKPVAEPIERAIADAAVKRKASTMKEYRATARTFLDWCAGNRVVLADDLNKDALMRFRRWSIARTLSNGERRADCTITKELTTVGAMLHASRESFAGLDSATIAEATRRERGGYGKPRRQTLPMQVDEIREALEACIAHDAAVFEMTRDQKRGGNIATPKHKPIAPFTLFCLLTGCRAQEACGLQWSEVGNGALYLGAERTKTRKGRRVTFAESPALQRLIEEQRALTGDGDKVFPTMTYAVAEKAKRRLVAQYSAPPLFGFQACRVTTVSFLATSGAIYGGASVFRAAKRTGHSVGTCERDYAHDAIELADDAAATIEGAMGVTDLADRIIARMARPLLRAV